MCKEADKNKLETKLTAIGVFLTAIAIVVGSCTATNTQKKAFESDVLIAFIQSDCLEQQQFIANADNLENFPKPLIIQLNQAYSCRSEEPLDEKIGSSDKPFDAVRSQIAELVSDDRSMRVAARAALTSSLPVECKGNDACLNFLEFKLDDGNLLRKGSYRTSLGIALAISKQTDIEFLVQLSKRDKVIKALSELSTASDETIAEISKKASATINAAAKR
ncbi:MAG: hypothetical protein WBC85_05490 [Planktotalea sp.]|uniref:hypothetical protein n=1 Tax=Planktotalea sp. TaxID=2029877 RepID=UPI003C710AEF